MRLIWSGEGRSEETLRESFDFFGEQTAEQLQGICCDMEMPYTTGIKQRAFRAALVFDKFHVIRHLMDAVDELRREEIHEKGKAHKELIKRTRYLWLKNLGNLTDKEKARLGVLEKLNLKINRVYLLKEVFRDSWPYSKSAYAVHCLEKWFWRVAHLRPKPMRDFAWLLRRT
jgi:transposase